MHTEAARRTINQAYKHADTKAFEFKKVTELKDARHIDFAVEIKSHIKCGWALRLQKYSEGGGIVPVAFL